MIVVSGQNSVSAKYLIPLLRNKYKVMAFDDDQGNIRNYDFLENLFSEIKPEIFINLKEVSDIISCEYSRENCYNTNSFPLKHISKLCVKHNTKLIQLSTSYIYHNTKNQLCDEKSNLYSDFVYSDSKLLAEQYIVESSDLDYVIIRCAERIYERAMYINNLLNFVLKNKKINIIENQKLSLLFKDTFLDAIIYIIENKIDGIYNLCSINEVNLDELLNVFLKEYNLKNNSQTTYIINNIKYNEFLFPVAIPQFNTISDKKFKKTGFSHNADLFAFISDLVSTFQ